jgi:hypothetical protein
MVRVMGNKLARDAKSGKSLLILAHRDCDDLTFRDVGVPEVVPLYANFDSGKKVGYAVLKPQPGLIYALVYPDFKIKWGRLPSVILGLSGTERITEDGVRYAQGGVVAGASVVDHDLWEKLYGGEAA